MAEVFDIESRWPDLFEGLPPLDRDAIVQAFASSWHEGWVPNREDVELQVRHARGEISSAEVLQLAREAAERRAGVIAD